MTKMLIDVDEWYPVYSISKRYESGYKRQDEIEIPPDLQKRHDRIMAEFDALQRELAELLGRTTSDGA